MFPRLGRRRARHSLFVTIIFALIFLSGPATGAETRVLVPIHPGSTDGAYGSHWLSELWVLNNGAEPALVGGLLLPGCPFDPCVPFESPIPPGATVAGRAAFGRTDSANPGIFLEVDEAQIDDLAFRLRVADTSRSAFGLGISLPVIPETEVSGESIQFLGVPLEAGYREMLRVYAFDSDARKVRIHVYANDGFGPAFPDPLLGSFDLPLIAGSETQPAYAAISEIGAYVPTAHYRSIRINVEPEPGRNIWAMVTVTNNVTQEVTAILPN